MRWKSPTIFTADEEGKLLRAGVAFSLASDDGALARLRGRYRGFIDAARNPEALHVALAGVVDRMVGRAAFSSSTVHNQTFSGWLARVKQRFREKPAPTAAAPVRQATAASAKG